MRARVLGACVALLWLAAYAETRQGPARLADHVVVSIDGLRPDDYLPAATREARTPVLDALRQRASWAEGVIGQYPSLTYPSHTSIATGMRPVRHGIVQNTMFDPVGSRPPADSMATSWWRARGAAITGTCRPRRRCTRG